MTEKENLHEPLLHEYELTEVTQSEAKDYGMTNSMQKQKWWDEHQKEEDKKYDSLKKYQVWGYGVGHYLNDLIAA